MQEGRYAAKITAGRLCGEASPTFHYADKGVMATIGRHHAVAILWKFHFHGLVAWLLWLFVHLLYLMSFQSRVLVATQWAFQYFTFNRSARLILGERPAIDKPDSLPS
jgi:NADH dehydrogenase